MRMTRLVKAIIKGFKGLSEELTINFSGNTIIVGRSGSGKTSLMEALTLLMQSRGEEWLVLEGNYIVIHEPEDLVYGLDLNEEVRVGAYYEVDEDGEKLGRSIGLELNRGSIIGYHYSFRLSDYWVRQEIYLGNDLVATIEKVGNEGLMKYPVNARLCITPTHVIHEDAFMVCDGDVSRKAYSLAFILRNMLKNKFYYLGESRVCWWKRDYETTVDLPSNSVGSDGQYTVHQLSVIETRPEYEGVYNELMELVSELGIEGIKAGFTAPKRISGYVKVRGKWVPMYHAGLKVKALLPVIVQLALTPPGSVLLIDSIDLGLTPDELNVVVDIVNRIASRVGYQVIMSSKTAPTVNVKVVNISE
jgi:energy-coupling factor transporter ATP-binding protein EcfA2